MRQRIIGLMTSMAMFLTVAATSSYAENITPFFSSSYTLTDFGSPSGVPGNLGGLVFLDDSDLLVGGGANGPGGVIYSVPVLRDGSGQITGFGVGTLFSTAPYIDGGLAFGPGGDLFFTAYPTNQIGEIKPGSVAPDKTINATGVASSVGSLQFAPNGDLKILSYSSGGFYTGTLTPDGSGTYDLTGATLESTPGGGPEGLIYVPNGSPLFPGSNLLIADYGLGTISAYSVDANDNPILATQQDFITGLSGAEGAVIDPVTGDFLFSTYGGGNHIDVVTGFAAPPPTSTPEPGSLALLGSGLAMLAAVLRKKRV